MTAGTHEGERQVHREEREVMELVARVEEALRRGFHGGSELWPTPMAELSEFARSHVKPDEGEVRDFKDE